MIIQFGKRFYNIPKPLYDQYASRLTKASEEAVKGAKNIVKIGSNKLIKLLGGQRPTKASLSQKGVKKVAKKGAAATFGAGVVVGSLLPKGKKTSYTPPGGTLAPFPRKKKKKSKLAGVKPGRKPTPPPAKAPKLPKAKEIKPHSKPPKGMKNPMIMKSGTKKYASGGTVRKTYNY